MRVYIERLRSLRAFYCAHLVHVERIMEVQEYKSEDFEHVTLETKSNVIPFPGVNLEWLARDVMSAPYAEIRS